jgi:two-component system CheB/CheR fusion protein
MRISDESINLEETEAGALRKILMLIRSSAGVDFTHYKESTILRRIQRRMALHQLEQMIAYLRFLQERQSEVEVLFKDLLIGVTSFFRDPQAFGVLEKKIIPLLLEQKKAHSPLRIWVPGCSTGEEALSIAILLAEAQGEMNMPFDVQIFATDVDPDAVEYARAGKYPESIAADVPEELLQKYFRKEDKGYKASKKIREMVVYAVQNLVLDPPFSRLDLISCRNLLIYLDTTLQQKVFSTLYYSLRQDGFLFLGSSESIGTFTNLFSLSMPDGRSISAKGPFSG